MPRPFVIFIPYHPRECENPYILILSPSENDISESFVTDDAL